MRLSRMHYKLRVTGRRTGTATELAELLTEEEFDWLLSQTPKGESLMLVIAALVSDAAAEDS